MKITPIKKFQEGGAVAPEDQATEQAPAEQAPEQAPAEQPQQQDPIMMLAQMSAQALQSQDCNMAMQVCQAFLQIAQQAGGGAPQQPQGQPVFKKGGKLLKRI